MSKRRGFDPCTEDAIDVYPFDFAFLRKVQSRIINEVQGVCRVTYDSKQSLQPEPDIVLTIPVTSKPPGTIEME